MRSFIDWDAWRAAYGELSLADQQAFYDAVFLLHPEQRHYSGAEVKHFLCERWMCDTPEWPALRVLELGGWRGELAAEMLASMPAPMIHSWTGIEVCRLAAAASVCRDIRFDTWCPGRWLWEREPEDYPADVFVACHVIEHLSDQHLLALCAWLRRSEIGALFLEAPIPESRQPGHWAGFCGSHILEAGWDEISRWLEPEFRLVGARGHCRTFARTSC